VEGRYSNRTPVAVMKPAHRKLLPRSLIGVVSGPRRWIPEPRPMWSPAFFVVAAIPPWFRCASSPAVVPCPLLFQQSAERSVIFAGGRSSGP